MPHKSSKLANLGISLKDGIFVIKRRGAAPTYYKKIDIMSMRNILELWLIRKYSIPTFGSRYRWKSQSIIIVVH